MGNCIKKTIRLNPSQNRILREFAKRRELSDYSMLAKIVDAGIQSLIHGADKEVDILEMAREIGSMSARIAEVERVLDRTLFTTCAGYAYARHAALGTHKSDEVIAGEAKAAFERQRAMAYVDE
ncbi:MAG: hypothetical protein H6918_04610 [Sphingomonadaceae bacterium]|nr:hypothetical protein [Sphingomonadaceae bacterium]